jgi:hypothetical protein
MILINLHRLVRFSLFVVLTLCKFRTTNHKLPIEQGRWNNIQRENRKCNLCNLEEIGDEFPYILNCPYFKTNAEETKGRCK